MTEQYIDLTLDSESSRITNVPELSGKLDSIDFDCSYDIFSTGPVVTAASGIFLLVKFPYEAIRAFIGDREISSSLNRINNHLYRIDTSQEQGVNSGTQFTIIGFKPDYLSHGPMRVIDTLSSVKMVDIVPWDPARDIHSAEVMVNVDVVSESDPVRFSLDTSSQSDHTWMDDKVGTVWLDTSDIGYKPYYQKQLFSNITEQLLNWGKLADWASPSFFQWTRSAIPPLEYDDAARVQEGDISIPIDKRAAGISRKVPFINGNPVNMSELHVDFWVVEGLPNFNNYFQYADPFDNSSGFPYIDIYVDGQHRETILLSQFLNDFNTTSKYNIREQIHLVRSLTDLDTGELYPWVQLQPDYLVRDAVEPDGTVTQHYFFWVEKKRIPQENKSLSLVQMEDKFKEIGEPHFIFGGFSFPTQDLTKRERMTVCYLRNIEQYINESDRYTVQLIFDETFRDTVRQGAALEHKTFKTQVREYSTGRYLGSVHNEWQMFRQDSDSLVPLMLWRKLTESCMGVRLLDFEQTGTLTPLPGPSVSSFDEVNGTRFRYGIGKRQIMAPPADLIRVIEQTLISPDFNIEPLDKFVFLDAFNFDTIDDIVVTMEYIYQSFPLAAVNRLFFNCLNEAISINPDLSDIMKTSYLAVHGIKLLETVDLQGVVVNE